MSVDSCVILCGGASSRLKGASGESKIFLPFGGKSLVAHNFSKMSEIFGRVFIACKENQVDLIEKSLDCFGDKSPRNDESTPRHYEIRANARIEAIQIKLFAKIRAADFK